MITGLYAAVFTFFLVFLAFNVVRRRWAHKVSLGHGGVEELEKHIRAHGNFVETVPIVLFLMLIMELGAVAGWAIHAMGLTLLAGRVIHALAVTGTKLVPNARVVGMALTFTAMLSGAVASLLLSLSLMPGFMLSL